MALEPTPYDIFGPTPFSGDQLTAPLAPMGGLAGEIIGEPKLPTMPMYELMHAPSPVAQPEPIITKLKPGSELHQEVLKKLDAMLRFSMDAMQKNHTRWNFMERKVQAFINEQDYDALMDALKNDRIMPPEPIQVVVPYAYATLHAAATYISTVLFSRKPIFNLAAARGTEVDSARHMEQVLQGNLDASGGHEMLWQQIWDGLNYSFGATGIQWENKHGPIMRVQNGQKIFEDGLMYSGNKLGAIDPYNYFPDPRVPLHKCPTQGDFIMWRRELSKTVLYDMEKPAPDAQYGQLMWVKEACDKAKDMSWDKASQQPSQRRIRLGQVDNKWLDPRDVVGFVEVYEGTVRLVPKDWKLGTKDTSELWKFTWTKSGQIMQAQPLNMLHGMHPVAVQEPNSLGYDFMSLSIGEMVTVFQDILSWLVSSRMENVRAAIANTFIVDPARVEVNDIRSSTIGRVIRMKQAAMGLPIQQAIQQLAVTDVTGGHLADLQTIRLLADATTGVNDNLRGIQTQGGRRSATEARMSMQAGASRLSQLAVRISSQAMLPMCDQMILNVQQFMPPEMWVEVTGDTGQPNSLQMTPEMLAGSFNYQVTDGSLPLDKAALTEVWKEILFGIARDPELRQSFSLVEVFKYVAELGGAKNIDSFQQQPRPMIAPPGQEPSGQPVGAAIPPPPASQVF